MEEDFRLTTKVEVDNYSQADLTRKPNLPGLEFSCLLDQVNGQLLKHDDLDRPLQLLVRATGGTSLWLARHLSFTEISTELIVSVESDSSDSVLLNELNELSNVVDAFEESGNYFRTKYVNLTDCSVVACRKDLFDWLGPVEHEYRLNRKPTIVYDPKKELAAFGRYYMNLHVWVND